MLPACPGSPSSVPVGALSRSNPQTGPPIRTSSVTALPAAGAIRRQDWREQAVLLFMIQTAMRHIPMPVPNRLRVMQDRAVLILDVMPYLGEECWARYGPNDDQLARRKSFYRTETPESVPLDEMTDVYRAIAAENGFDLEWHAVQHRRSSYFSGL